MIQIPTLMVAIRNFINDGSSNPVTVAELKAFKDICTPEDRAAYKKELESYGFEIEDKS